MKDEDNAFGFDLVSESDIKQSEELIIKQHDNKIQGILNLIMPLLNNLKKNPEKDFVKWPNRTKDIENFIKKLNEYIAS